MVVENRIVQTNEVPKYTMSPFPPGSNSIYTAGIVQQNNQNNAQNTLINNKTGGRIQKKYKGGNTAPVVVVPPPPSYAVDKAGTVYNNTLITKLTIDSTNNAKYDNTTSQSDVAKISTDVNNTYYGKGGKKRAKCKNKSKKNKQKGGWPNWTCLSGGKKQTKRYKRNLSRKRTKKYKH